MMKRPLFLALTLLFACANMGDLWSQTTVNSDLLVNTTWTDSQSPIVISNSIRIDSGVVLTINPGVVVRVADQSTLTVEGILRALGTETDSVFFQADNQDWGGIQIADVAGSQAEMDYCVLANASTAINGTGLTSNNHLQLSNTLLRNCMKALDGFPQQLFEINACSFEDNNFGLYESDLSLRQCVFNRNATGIFSGNISLDSCDLNKSTLSAIEGGSGSVKRSSFYLNAIALSGFGTTNLDSVLGCKIILNDTGIVAANDQPEYFANQICSNGLNLVVSTPSNISLENNCWCTLDSNAVASGILDGNDQVGLGTVNFIPMDSCQFSGTVWPGDANNDGVAKITDVLSVGIAFGSQGTTRPNATQIWAAQTGVPWGFTFADGTDYVHSDCDGNGIVGFSDTAAILTNFGQTHPKTSLVPVIGNAELCISYPATAMPGDTFLVDLFLQNSTAPIDVYGFAITLGYDRTIIDSARITTSRAGSFAPLNSSALDVDVSRDQFHWAISRTDHQDTLFSGRLGGLEMIMVDDLARVIPLNLTVDEVMVVDSSGARYAVNISNCPPNAQRMRVDVYPNPGAEQITVDWNGYEAEAVEIYSPAGLRVGRWESPTGNTLECDTRTYNPGVYLVRVQVPNGILTKKVIITK